MSNNTQEELRFQYKHARAEVATDIVVFGYDSSEKELYILLQYKEFNFLARKGWWALPGSFIRGSDDPSKEYGEPAETLDDCINRVLRVETNGRRGRRIVVWQFDRNQSFIEYLPPQTKIDRDLRGKRVISLPAMVCCKMSKLSPLEQEFVRWIPLSKIEEDNKHEQMPDEEEEDDNNNYKLPFDHYQIYVDGIERLRQIVRVQPIGRQILGDRFTLLQLQQFYEVLLGGKMDKATFRKWALDEKRELLESLHEYDKNSSNRPALFYKFNLETYQTLQRTKELGFNLKVHR